MGQDLSKGNGHACAWPFPFYNIDAYLEGAASGPQRSLIGR